MNYKLFLPLAIHELGQRQNQEDNIYPVKGEATPDNRLFIVCDGMGGHEKGEVASNLVCQSISEYVRQHASSADGDFSDELFCQALAYAYTRLDAADDGAAKKMGTTLTFLFLHRDGAIMAHIGDSRIYHIRPGKGILYQSRDHSLVFELFQAGEITYDEMRTSPQKNIITRAMQPGEENRVKADIVHTTDIRPDDYFYLCTDGMLEEMENDELASILSADISDEEKRQRLILATADNKDNHSAYLIHIKDVVREEGDDEKPNDEATSRFNAIRLINPVPSDASADMPGGEEDDVVVVEEPPTPPLSPTDNPPHVLPPFLPNWQKWVRRLAKLLLLIAVAVFGYLLHGWFSKEKTETEVEKVDTTQLHRPKPIVVVPEPEKSNTAKKEVATEAQETEAKAEAEQEENQEEEQQEEADEKVDPKTQKVVEKILGNGKQ